MNVLYYRMVNQGYGVGSPYPAYPATSSALAPSTPTGLAANTPAAMATTGLPPSPAAAAAAAGLTPKWIIPNFSATQIQYMFRPRMGKGVKVNRAVKCETCSITLNSEQQAKQHYSGKSHLKKLRQMGLPVPGSDQGKVQAQSGKNKRKRSSSESKDSKQDEDGKESTTESNPDAKSDTSDNSAASETEDRESEKKEEKEGDEGGDDDEDGDGDDDADADDSPPRKSPRLSPPMEDEVERSEVNEANEVKEVKDTASTGTNEKKEKEVEDAEDNCEKDEMDDDTDGKAKEKKRDEDHSDQDQCREKQERKEETARANENTQDHIKMEHSTPRKAKESSASSSIPSTARFLKQSPMVMATSSSSGSHGYKPQTSFYSNRSSDYSRGFPRGQTPSFASANRSSVSFGNRTEARPGCLLPTPPTSVMSGYTPYQQYTTPQGASLSAGQLMSSGLSSGLTSGLQQYPSLSVSPFMPVAPLSFPQRSPTAPSQLSSVPGLIAPLYAPPAISSSPYSSIVTPQSATLGVTSLSDTLGGSLGSAGTPQTGLLDINTMSSFPSLPLNSATTHQMALQSDTTLLSRQQQTYSQSHLSLAQFAISETANPGGGQSLVAGVSQTAGASSLPLTTSKNSTNSIRPSPVHSASKLDPVTQAVYDNMMGKLPLKRKKNIPCTVCDMVFDSDVVANQHFLGAKHCKKARMTTTADVTQAKSSSPPASTGITESEALVKSAIALYRCEVCNLDLNSAQQFEQHNIGQLHLRNQKEKERVKPPPFQWTRSVLGWGEEAGNKPGWFYCQPCDISVQTAMQLQQHVRSQRHRDHPPGGYGRLARESQD